MNILKAMFGNYSKKELKRIEPIKQKVLDLENKYEKMSEKELKDQTNILKSRLEKGETLDDILPDAFAVCREAAWRVLGMKHFPVQIIGGIVLHQGRIAEMKTGEGKTLVATLPAYLNGLTGNGVHIVTVNDYLAKRDSEWMGKLYRYLGLTVGLIIHEKVGEDRKNAYLADITYGTNNELGFDYLRDNMVVYKEQKVQRQHAYAVVDEVDSILIDEARTPLIISGKGDKSTDLYEKADRFAKTLHHEKFAEIDNKQDNDEYYKENNIHYIVDEKAKSSTLTAIGVKKAEEYFGVENLTDVENLTLQHHINQAIKANGIMKKDIDYVVKDEEVVIVDEFTGRLMNGRRYNEGLHQAIEAKEGVKVESESKTLATITFQNYFRLYKKLSGMTGTAMTEEVEFKEIYSLDVIEIPTNKELLRVDHPDTIFKTESGKYNAVIEDIVNCYEKGQPVLVGTISIEKSELLSKMLKKKGVKHNVLNAKQHEKEADIVAQAGKRYAVTIATNMAGRGTDIVLGGNAEYMAKAEMRKMQFSEELIAEATGYSQTEDEEILNARDTFKTLHDKHKIEIEKEATAVREAGGLFIMGTERHESRRIDNQLRGRAGRQGDTGASKFYLSTEDDLMRLFGGERVKMVMDRLNTPDDMPIENKMISNMIESSQQKVESRNFAIRKNVLQYDDVLNRQREIIYKQRNQVLDGDDVKSQVVKMLEETVESRVNQFCSDNSERENWNVESLKDYYLGWLIEEDEMHYTLGELEDMESKQLTKFILDKATALYDENESSLTPETMREVERVCLLRNVDTFWMEHIDAMESLKQGIRLRAYSQRDPVVEYRLEGFDMFDEMIETIKENTVKGVLLEPKRMIARRIQNEELAKRKEAIRKTIEERKANLIAQSEEQKEEITPQFVIKREQVATPTSTSSDGTLEKRPTVKTAKEKVGRNDPCPCGSGKKHKKCCGKDQ